MDDENNYTIENDNSTNPQIVNYSICSIYYDMLNAPSNIDIKKIISIIMNNTKKHTIYIIRVIKHKNILQKLYDNMIMENDIKCHFTIHEMIKSHTIDLLEAINIWGKWSKIVKANKITVDSIVFITANNINIINDINKNIYLVTDFEKTDNLNFENVVSINYNDYLINDLSSMRNEIEEYDKYNWHNISIGKSVINKRVFYQLNMFIEALNTEKLDFACFKYYYHFVNMELTEQSKYIDQYVLLFDYENP